MSLAKFIQQSKINRVCTLEQTAPGAQAIVLTAGKNKIGRSVETGIRDVHCSKTQMCLDVDTKKFQVNIEVLGTNPSSLNGFMLKRGSKAIALHGDIVEIIFGKLPYEIVFKPPPRDEKQMDKPTESSVGIQGTWNSESNGKLVTFSSRGVKSSPKIAGYDIDGTIIKTKSGNVFPKTMDDWQLWHTDIPNKLKKLHSEGFKICFFTNQFGIGKGKTNLDDFKCKITSIIDAVGVPTQVFIATNKSIYRKPAPGMWNHLVEKMNDGIDVDKENSFFVGDAAGRKAEGKRKSDHSCCDRLFAINVKLPFFTPEEHFLNMKPVEWTKPSFNPTFLPMNVQHIEPPDTKIPSNGSEVILLVGLPGSGKSVFAKNTLEPLGYEIINADSLHGVPACIRCCEKALQSQKRCVIDNTNVDLESRKKFIKIAERHNVPCRCFVMKVSFGQVLHNLAFRELVDTKHSHINQMVINSFKKKYVTPSTAEGFTEIVEVNLKYEFKNAADEKLYKLYLMEK